MGFNKHVSYNAHYVKWMVNWWKILVFKIENKRFYVKYSLSQREISTVDLFCNIMSDAQINKYSIILSKLSELSDLSNFPDYPTFATWIRGILRDPKSVREETAKRILQALHQKTDYKP